MESISLMSLGCRVTPIIQGSIPKIINQDNKVIFYTQETMYFTGGNQTVSAVNSYAN
jgi:hypothetical protein